MRMLGERRAAAGVAVLLGCVFVLGASALPAQTLEEATGLVRSGSYEEGLEAMRVLTRVPSAPPEARRFYARTLMEVGRYQDAVRAVAGEAGRAAAPELENVYGEALRSVGRGREAEASFRRAMESPGPEANVARLNLGVLLWERGEREEASALFDAFIDLYNRSQERLSPDELMAVGTAVRYLGITSPPLFQDALMAYDEAGALDPGDPRPPLLAGELFLSKYRATDARASFREVLSRNPRDPRALLGLARTLFFEDAPGAMDTVSLALEVNPRDPEARTFLAELLLEVERHDEARAEARKALEVNPEHLPALGVLAASHYLKGDSAEYREVRDRVAALNPRHAELYREVAEMAVTQRQYRRAVELARRAVQIDSTSWASWGLLGMNQLRTGEVDAGRRSLERAFEGDPYNPWFKNSLDLLDTFAHYETIRTEHFEILIHEREAELLGPYAAAFAEESYAALRERYQAEPPLPIRVEIFPSHADFSVRTLGLPGLGALGVSFGSTLVMNSPSVHDAGDFNWASTLWHEVAHAFHLAVSDHRVPRWFTEGLAVREQRVARPPWGSRPSPAWLQAYELGRLHPVSRLNDGFIHPDYPEQVVFSYLQASLVFDLVEERWGMDTVLAMLQGYREGKSNEQVFREVLGTSPEAFDETFDSYVQERWGARMEAVILPGGGEAGRAFHDPGNDLETLRRRAVENPRSFPIRLALGKALFEEGSLERAEEELRAALLLFPEYGGPDSPYLYLARIHDQRGEKELAARALHRLGELNETQHSVHAREAELRLELGDTAAAVAALEKVVEIAPFGVPPHRLLAELYEATANAEGAVRERRAILALDPADRADAHYRLAVALKDAGEREEARREVVRALEIAPSFEAALDLLLELRKEGGR